MSSVSHLSEICGYLHGVNSRKTMYVYTYVLLNITNLQSVYKQRPSKVFPVFLNGKSLKEIVVFPVGLTGPFRTLYQSHPSFNGRYLTNEIFIIWYIVLGISLLCLFAEVRHRHGFCVYSNLSGISVFDVTVLLVFWLCSNIIKE